VEIASRSRRQLGAAARRLVPRRVVPAVPVVDIDGRSPCLAGSQGR